MQLVVTEMTAPEKITFNYEELKAELSAKLADYETLVYTEGQLREAKSDKANLNKLKKALNDERIRLEREYMRPFSEFKSQIAEIIAMIDKPIAAIDTQIRGYEEKRKQEKKSEILDYLNSVVLPPGISKEAIFEDRWLNATVSMSQVKKEADEKLSRVFTDLSALENVQKAYRYDAIMTYRETLDLRAAISTANRLAERDKLRAEAAAQAPDEESAQWVSFKALLTVSQAAELKEFFDSRKIYFKKV